MTEPAPSARSGPAEGAGDLRERKRRIVDRYGPWTAHNLHLGDGVYTRGEHETGDDVKLRRVGQIVADLAPAPPAELRLLDLACLEGLYAVEFARRGAEVVGIEGRAASIAKARFAAEVLGLERLTLLHDDVRTLSLERHGRFDVVLCLGILYHLPHPDLFELLERIAEVCAPGGLLVLDTHVGLRPWVARDHGGRRYWGRVFLEHAPFSSAERRRRAAWASLDNTTSFWPTRPSLINALVRAGFASVYECAAPAEPGKAPHRVTLVGLRGPLRQVVSSRFANERAEDLVPERRSWWRRLLPGRAGD